MSTSKVLCTAKTKKLFHLSSFLIWNFFLSVYWLIIKYLESLENMITVSRCFFFSAIVFFITLASLTIFTHERRHHLVRWLCFYFHPIICRVAKQNVIPLISMNEKGRIQSWKYLIAHEIWSLKHHSFLPFLIDTSFNLKLFFLRREIMH